MEHADPRGNPSERVGVDASEQSEMPKISRALVDFHKLVTTSLNKRLCGVHFIYKTAAMLCPEARPSPKLNLTREWNLDTKLNLFSNLLFAKQNYLYG